MTTTKARPRLAYPTEPGAYVLSSGQAMQIANDIKSNRFKGIDIARISGEFMMVDSVTGHPVINDAGRKMDVGLSRSRAVEKLDEEGRLEQLAGIAQEAGTKFIRVPVSIVSEYATEESAVALEQQARGAYNTYAAVHGLGKTPGFAEFLEEFKANYTNGASPREHFRAKLDGVGKAHELTFYLMTDEGLAQPFAVTGVDPHAEPLHRVVARQEAEDEAAEKAAEPVEAPAVPPDPTQRHVDPSTKPWKAGEVRHLSYADCYPWLHDEAHQRHIRRVLNLTSDSAGSFSRLSDGLRTQASWPDRNAYVQNTRSGWLDQQLGTLKDSLEGVEVVMVGPCRRAEPQRRVAWIGAASKSPPLCANARAPCVRKRTQPSDCPDPSRG
jgi:hypothetical protein